MLSRVDAVPDNSFFAIGSRQPADLDEHNGFAISSHQDRRLLTAIQHTGGNFIRAALLERVRHLIGT